jgi:2-isopropylmalate synthase
VYVKQKSQNTIGIATADDTVSAMIQALLSTIKP